MRGSRSARARARTAVALPLATMAVLASTTSCSTPGASTLNRPADPVVVSGAQAAALIGVPAGRVVAFRVSAGAWKQIPVQVDERVATTMDKVYGVASTTAFYGSRVDNPVTVYADAGTFVGADPDPALDADDEIAFMARDAGGSATGLAAPAGTTGGGIEVKIDDPLSYGSTGSVYLFSSTGSLDPGAGQRYVDYRFQLMSGDYRSTYKREDGPNPENSTVVGSTYSMHFADRWLMDSLTLTQGSKPTADLVDRFKYDIRAFCARNENTFNDDEGAFIVNRSGPVRALRSYVGANSGPNTQNTHVFYDQAMYTVTDLRVHFIPSVSAHLDLSREAYGMTFRNPQVPWGVTVDGSPDSVPTATPTWWTISGAQGGLALSASFDTNATSAPQTAYEDNTSASSDAACTGDGEAIGDSGALFNGAIECTDPGWGCTDHLSSRYRFVATSSSATPAETQAIAEQGLTPLVVLVRGR